MYCAVWYIIVTSRDVYAKRKNNNVGAQYIARVSRVALPLAVAPPTRTARPSRPGGALASRESAPRRHDHPHSARRRQDERGGIWDSPSCHAALQVELRPRHEGKQPQPPLVSLGSAEVDSAPQQSERASAVSEGITRRGGAGSRTRSGVGGVGSGRTGPAQNEEANVRMQREHAMEHELVGRRAEDDRGEERGAEARGRVDIGCGEGQVPRDVCGEQRARCEETR